MRGALQQFRMLTSLSHIAAADFATLAAAGITVHTFDAHGHGRSEPRAQKARGFVKRFSDLVRPRHHSRVFVREVLLAHPAQGGREGDPALHLSHS
jgi:alpha-beta hydrolase superfamily lysophospholipase